MYRRGVIAGLLCIGAAVFAAAPASAQTSAYNAAETSPPAISGSGPVGAVLGSSGPAGAVLGSAGQRLATPAPAVSGQVLSLQVRQSAPAATGGQASVSGLAFTGADVITLLLVAVPMIVLGLTLTRHARPRQALQG